MIVNSITALNTQGSAYLKSHKVPVVYPPYQRSYSWWYCSDQMSEGTLSLCTSRAGLILSKKIGLRWYYLYVKNKQPVFQICLDLVRLLVSHSTLVIQVLGNFSFKQVYAKLNKYFTYFFTQITNTNTYKLQIYKANKQQQQISKKTFKKLPIVLKHHITSPLITPPTHHLHYTARAMKVGIYYYGDSTHKVGYFNLLLQKPNDSHGCKTQMPWTHGPEFMK